MNKFLLLLGPSGVGKTSIINELKRIDKRFEYISPYTTRQLRDGENDKKSISDETMHQMSNLGLFLTINEKYGIKYATPKFSIRDSIDEGRFPVLDWPIDRLEIMEKEFSGKLLVIYIEPPSLEDLRIRLNCDERDVNGVRFEESARELERLWRGDFEGRYHFRFISKTGEIPLISQQIYNIYTESMCEGNSHGKEIC